MVAFAVSLQDGSGADLPSLILGAALALLGSLVVQLFVVPRVDQRKRREARWEEHLVALGELLTGPYSEARTDLAQALAEFDSIHDPDGVRLGAEIKRAMQLTERADWLRRRVVGIAPQSSRLQPFWAAWNSWVDAEHGINRLAQNYWQRAFDVQKEDLTIALDGAHDFWRTDALIAAIDHLLVAGPPHTPLRRRRQPREPGEVGA